MNQTQKMSVYIETSVISYLTSKINRNLIVAAHQNITQEWWEKRKGDFELYVSSVVIAEITRGDEIAVQKRLQVVQGIKTLEPTSEVSDLAALLIAERIIPQKAAQDAVHLSIAMLNKIDCLLSWNCKHIVNLEIIKKIAQVAQTKGYTLPTICTPLHLMEKLENE